MTASLAGLYFLEFSGDDGPPALVRQGRMLAELGDGYWLVEIQEWAAGRAIRREIITLDDARRAGWWLFTDHAAQQAEVARWLQRQQRGDGALPITRPDHPRRRRAGPA